ncbi:unnamed protein product [Didymodactylos carnosus]|uniref:Uncharacterized protein n=2 Tax=Didymodactylos carnosus TaxID=1234261 RepID=A0A8S2SEX1_9BILA|nr:unnamed protein product [Didymodactylos carnosus]CAF4224314.1 unnamed protein product [Didymodactylos carnosus]
MDNRRFEQMKNYKQNTYEQLADIFKNDSLEVQLSADSQSPRYVPPQRREEQPLQNFSSEDYPIVSSVSQRSPQLSGQILTD